jgi:hypothetical protein
LVIGSFSVHSCSVAIHAILGTFPRGSVLVVESVFAAPAV